MIFGIFGAALLLFWSLQFHTPYIIDPDGYYHVKFALLWRTIGIHSVFPWATQSLWATHFSDKEFLYHALLAPLTRMADLAKAIKWLSVLLAASVTTSFYGVLRRDGIRFAPLWTALFCLSSGSFLFRLCLNRPHVLAVGLAIWILYFVLNRNRFGVMVGSALYTLSYTACHLPFGIAVICSGALYLFDRKLDWRTPAFALLGTSLGLLLHPDLLNYPYLFFIQDFAVPWQSLTGTARLDLAMEFEPYSTRQVLSLDLVFCLALLAIPLSLITRPFPVSSKAKQLFVLALVFLTLFACSRRYIEYAAPVGIFFCAHFFDGLLQGVRWPTRLSPRFLGASALGMTVLALLVWHTVYVTVHEITNVPNMAAQREVATITKRIGKPGDVVFTCSWDDTAPLFFYDHERRYIDFLDPSFAYYKDPQRWQIWQQLSAGALGKESYRVLRESFNARFGFCQKRFGLAAIARADPRMHVLLESKYYLFFEIKPEPSSGPPLASKQGRAEADG